MLFAFDDLLLLHATAGRYSLPQAEGGAVAPDIPTTKSLALERMADPDAAARFRRIEQRAKRETGQQFFWRPRRRVPERAPDLAAAVFRR